jgi:hypothetical protein
MVEYHPPESILSIFFTPSGFRKQGQKNIKDTLGQARKFFKPLPSGEVLKRGFPLCRDLP